MLLQVSINEMVLDFCYRNPSRSEFVFYADRLIRLVVEEGLNQLSYTECTVITPTGKSKIVQALPLNEYYGVAKFFLVSLAQRRIALTFWLRNKVTLDLNRVPQFMATI
uniref:Putative uracil phosphoribosyltransferase n=1 Tax=Ixodes ricinus TaxID=34613 RepID=A0A0K8RJ75_IXORI